MRRKPYSVLLLDGSRRHTLTYNILQVFDDGRLTDGNGAGGFHQHHHHRHVQPGSDIIQRRLKARGRPARVRKTKAGVMDVLRGHFRPEFLNRIDEIIVFHALGKERSATSSACSSIAWRSRRA
ncbi:Chaperone protein ClpB [Klebsiella pneumoniae]|nr:Chaperone protein ClpB [Klebsiella pneumoniae]